MMAKSKEKSSHYFSAAQTLSVLQKISAALVSDLDFESMTQRVVDTMVKDLQYLGGILFLVNKKKNEVRAYTTSSTKVINAIVKALPSSFRDHYTKLQDPKDNVARTVKYNKVYIGNRLSDFISPAVDANMADWIQRFARVKSTITIPVRGKQEIIGALLLNTERDEFSDEEITILQAFANQVGVAIENARFYQQINNFNTELKQKVSEATAQIQRQYQDLLVLRKITDIITSTLDLQKVCQEIVNSVTTRLNFVAGFISLIDAETYQLYPTAISETAGMDKVRNLLGDFRKLRLAVDDKRSKLSQAVSNMEVYTTDNLTEVLSPPLNPRIAQRIQKMNKIAGVIVLPIMAQGRALGALTIGLDKPAEEIMKQEKETLITLANEAGLAIDNALLFERTQQFNVQLKDEVSRATKELRDANAKLKKLDKAKSEFISIASHQLRTPLSTIKGYLSMILAGDYGMVTDSVGKVLGRVYNSNERLVTLVNNMLNVSRIESGRITMQPKPFQIENTIEDVMGELAPEAKARRVDLIFKKPTWQPKKVIGDKRLLHEVLVNLVDNSIKYTPHGTVKVTLHRHFGQLEVRVKDDGVGMTKDDQSRLFKKFSRGRDAYRHYTGGSGLGLYVVRRLVEMNGGTIQGSSPGRGKGSTFKFTIPYA